VVGAEDAPFLAASDYMAAKIPGAKKVVIPAAGHAVNTDQPQAFITRSCRSLPACRRSQRRKTWRADARLFDRALTVQLSPSSRHVRWHEPGISRSPDAQLRF
jgi:hypothetical protein